MSAEIIKKVLDGARIICVDDSIDYLTLLRSLLTHHGALVTTCSSAEEAIEILEKERFDLLITDISMPPGLDGYDLTHALRDMEVEDPSRRPTPTMAVSGVAKVPSKKRKFADFQVYIAKPFENAGLVNIVERLIDADGESVVDGSLDIWEAGQATVAAETATNDASNLTLPGAPESMVARAATSNALEATKVAYSKSQAAYTAERRAAEASSAAH